MPVTKHTPGPWRINPDCQFARYGKISIEADDYFIALVDTVSAAIAKAGGAA